ncbi:hypothetical protein JRQ81_008882 [Phrynocephalus forsythii]|uniref:LRRCT domain-containing protein n=1 Tax=Phrynocephalus forsythii TaxID=171643 RepID=A0A9Q1AT25_9SAUR|nr:hypothetical protein JRQ81_008882 [Phrynocephalus forsythii]
MARSTPAIFLLAAVLAALHGRRAQASPCPPRLGLKDGTEFTCNSPSLSEFPSGFPEQTRLISVEFTNISIIAVDALRALPHLEELHLSNNKLKTLSNSLFRFLPRLRTVDLSNNQLRDLPPGLFRNNTALAVVSLKGNRLTHLRSVWFETLSQLQILDVSENQLIEVPPFSFDTLENLTNLDLSHNRLRELSPRVFAGLARLTGLNLEGNQIHAVQEKTFRAVPNLKFLFLQNNSLADLPAGLFASLDALEMLDLSNNRLTSLDPDFSDRVADMSLDLSGNPWRCDCRMKALVDWVKNRSVALLSKKETTCASPKKLRGREIMSLTPAHTPSGPALDTNQPNWFPEESNINEGLIAVGTEIRVQTAIPSKFTIATHTHTHTHTPRAAWQGCRAPLCRGSKRHLLAVTTHLGQLQKKTRCKCNLASVPPGRADVSTPVKDQWNHQLRHARPPPPAGHATKTRLGNGLNTTGHVNAMSSDESGTAGESTPKNKETEEQNVVSRVAGLPLVSSTYDMVSAAYASTKGSHPLLKSVCDVAEKGVWSLTAAAACGAQPLLTKLGPQIAMANEYACRGLEKLEENLPVLQQPSEKVVADTKELVSAKVTGAREVVALTVHGAKDAVTGGVSGAVVLAKGAMRGGMNTLLGSRVGQLVATGVDAVLGKSEELVDHFLPMTDQELAELATAVEGFEVATVEQQKEQRSYFVRLGSLSAKVRHRAYQYSLAKVKEAKQGTQEALAQLHQTIELIEQAKQGVDQKIQSGQEKLHQMWLQVRQKQPSEEVQTLALDAQQMEVQALEVSRSLVQQLQSATATLVAHLQGLPAGLQEKVSLVRQHADDLRASFTSAKSFQDLSSAVLAQSQEKVAKARELTEELMEQLAQNAPLSWLVGPFTPSGKPEVEEIEME